MQRRVGRLELVLGRNRPRRRPRAGPSALGVGPAGFEQPGALRVQVPRELGRPAPLNEVKLALGGLRNGLRPAARGGGVEAGKGPISGVRAAAFQGHSLALPWGFPHRKGEVLGRDLGPVNADAVAPPQVQNASFVRNRQGVAGGARTARHRRPVPGPGARGAPGPRRRIAGRIAAQHGKRVRRPKQPLAGEQKPAGDRGAAPRQRIGSPKKLREVQHPEASVSKLRKAALARQGMEQHLRQLQIAGLGRGRPARGDEGAVPGSSVGMDPAGEHREHPRFARRSGPKVLSR